MRAELVVTGYQVVVEEDGKRKPMGRVYQVRDAAIQLRDLFRQQGKDAHCVEVMKFEGDKKVIR